MSTKKKLVFAVAATAAAALPVLATPAFADYAPSSKDVVGVGSDTLQYASDFIDDGDYVGDPGYNTTGNANKVVSFDASADANARLAYGPQGSGTGTCSPGIGASVGTGNNTTNHTDQPCILNPTIVLRAGQSPVLRPNGSGAGASAAASDTGDYINFVRAASAVGSTLSAGGTSWDDIEIGTDALDMLTEQTTDAVPLSAQQLNAIYSCTDTKWTQVGGTSSNTIIPIIPVLGSAVRTTFLKAIGNPTLGTCVVVGEQNDPFAIDESSSPADTIEPFSLGRLNLYQGISGTGVNIGGGFGYFEDPSCPVETTNSTCLAENGSGSGTYYLAPKVKLTKTGTPSDGNAVFNTALPLYVYFRNSDVTSTKAFQPGSALNFVRTLFYNPCLTGQTGCVTVGGQTYGPGGQPYYDTAAGQADIAASGATPAYAVNIPGL